MMSAMLATFVRLPSLKAQRSFESLRAWPRLRTERPPFVEAAIGDLQTEGVHVTTVERLLGDAAPAFRAALARAAPLLHGAPEPSCWSARDASVDLAPGALLARLPDFYLAGLNARLLSLAEHYLRVPVAYHGAVLRRSFVHGHAAGPCLWHRDIEDLHVLRTVVYLTDVDESGGPFEYIPRRDRAARRDLRRAAPMPGDEEMRALVPVERWKRVTGPAGTVVLADSAQVFHHQSPQRRTERSVLMMGHSSRRPSGRALALSHFPVEDVRAALDRLVPPAQRAHVLGWRGE